VHHLSADQSDLSQAHSSQTPHTTNHMLAERSNSK